MMNELRNCNSSAEFELVFHVRLHYETFLAVRVAESYS